MGRNELACLLACVDTAENEPLEVWGKYSILFNRVLSQAAASSAPGATDCRKAFTGFRIAAGMTWPPGWVRTTASGKAAASSTLRPGVMISSVSP